MQPDELEAIRDDDGYQMIEKQQVRPGDIVVYRDNSEISHTGIVVRVESDEILAGGKAIHVLSKWGDAGEYEHSVHDFPDGNKLQVEYWSERI